LSNHQHHKVLKLQHFLLLLLAFVFTSVNAQKKSAGSIIVVDINGKGNYKSIQAALNSLTDTAINSRIIYIRNGVYNEKVYIEKHNVALIGEDREKTVVTQSIARDEWRCLHKDDWGVATINVDANDITFKNLTVINSFGFDFKSPVTIDCPADTVAGKKTIAKNSHQMALRTMKATRLSAINCRFSAFGGDTVSPWNVEQGMFYFKDCVMEGGVDFYCPRGWAWAENCKFITHSGDAAIWHDGSKFEESKTVLKNCSFEGYDGFKLGRYHKDAQFYLLNCTFANNMADKDIYLVPTTNKINWGRRIYYFNCRRKGGDYDWHKDNLSSAPGDLNEKNITPDWVFKGKWQPGKI
jgi:pectinesterase